MIGLLILCEDDELAARGDRDILKDTVAIRTADEYGLDAGRRHVRGGRADWAASSVETLYLRVSPDRGGVSRLGDKHLPGVRRMAEVYFHLRPNYVCAEKSCITALGRRARGGEDVPAVGAV